MSVVVWDGVTLACDSDMNDGQVKLPFEKIWQKGKHLYGVVGVISECVKLKTWVRNGCILDWFPQVSPETALIIVSLPDGIVTRYTVSTTPISHTGKIALGTGRDFAYGAMFMGGSAEDGVRAAIKYSASCSGEVITLKGEFT